MKSAIYIGLALLLVSSALAAIPLPKEKCNWVMPATEYRQERTFQGVWGRLSDGTLTCFMPGKHKKTITTPVIISQPVPVCYDIVKNQSVEKEFVCKGFGWRMHCAWEYAYETFTVHYCEPNTAPQLSCTNWDRIHSSLYKRSCDWNTGE
jgi:hypothetical protein